MHEVGPGARWTRIAELKAAGCPACGGTVLRPQPLRAGQGQAAMTDGTAGFLVRPARDGDLDVIAGFEIDIARASFGDEAIEDPALHRKRVAGALGKPGEVTLVAVAVKERAGAGRGGRAGGLGLAVRAHQLADRRQVRQLPVAGHRRYPGPRHRR